MARKGCLAFVVQKHKATSLHYDFRLEVAGVMPSWSVPKGPTLDPKVRRLAMPTGPHDLEYRKFEGLIGKGNYGAGQVIIWDTGSYNPEVEIEVGVRREVEVKADADREASRSLSNGNLKFRLYGVRLRGSFAFVRTKGWGGKESWLLLKHKDEHVKEGYDAKDYEESVVSHRRIEDLVAEGQGTL